MIQIDMGTYSDTADAGYAWSADIELDGSRSRLFSPPGYGFDFERRGQIELARTDGVIIGQRIMTENEPRESVSSYCALDLINLYGLADLSDLGFVLLVDAQKGSDVLSVLKEFEGRILFDWTGTCRAEVEDCGFVSVNGAYRKVDVSLPQARAAMEHMLSSSAFQLAFAMSSFRTGGLSSLPPALGSDVLSRSVEVASGGAYLLPASDFVACYRAFPFDEQLIGDMLDKYPELGSIEKKIRALEAIDALIDYVDRRGELDALRFSREELGTRENAENFVMETIGKSCLPELLESYLSGVPLEDLIA